MSDQYPDSREPIPKPVEAFLEHSVKLTVNEISELTGLLMHKRLSKHDQLFAKLTAASSSHGANDVAHGSKVDHPTHYNIGAIEVIDIIEDQGLGFHLGNVIKCLLRASHKNTEVEDLNKALWYLTRYINLRKRMHANIKNLAGT